ncbi:MAG: 3-dehydroquinate dehydratase [delta proteobacterium ML8_F1]|nr:MAG: 3-dehydroquinate dehydratase [delta proteobacterium ML8_F1]
MKKTCRVGNIVIGEGMPKVIVPIVGRSADEIVDKVNGFNFGIIDVVEWRVDFFEESHEIAKVLETLKNIRVLIGETPLIFTFRTIREGGEREIDIKEYSALNQAAARSGLADIIDIEIFSGDAVVQENIEVVHQAGKLVIASNHDFHQTPPESVLIERMIKMQDMGADISKIAVMPQTIADVIVLLSATNQMYERYADRPIVTMSMSPMGVISRLSGEVFGSSMTFGAVGQVSAPGQIPVEKLKNGMRILSESI